MVQNRRSRPQFPNRGTAASSALQEKAREIVARNRAGESLSDNNTVDIETVEPEPKEPSFTKLDTKINLSDPQFSRGNSRNKVGEFFQPVENGKKAQTIKERTETFKTFIINDANPFLVKTTSAWIGIPDESWLNGVVLEAINPQNGQVMRFWDPALRTRLELSDAKAQRIARAIAELSVSPMGVAVVTWIEQHEFMIAIGAALFVAGQYGFALMQTKAEVQQLRKVYEQQQAILAQQSAANQNGSPIKPPAFNQSVADYEAGN